MMRTKTRTSASSTDRATAYAQEVVAGKLVAGPHVRNACRRHLDDLTAGSERGLRYDEAEAEKVIGWFEGVLKLSEGQFEGRPLQLHPSQAFIIGSVFGWRRADGTRRFRRAYIEQGKGNGKSPLAGGIGLYGMTADGEGGAQIYAAAAKKEQATILFQDACKMVRKSPALERRLAFSGGLGREFNIAHHASGSFFRPISKDAGKTGSGPRPHFALCDEVHEHPDRTIMEMLERGFKFRRQPLLFMITNSGSDRNSVCWEEHQHAVRVAAGTATPDEAFTYVGEAIDDTTFSYVCALDPGDDPLESPACWAKANPLLGVTITEEYLAGVVKQAKQLPGKLNGILRLHFCVWTDAETAWMARPALEACLDDFEPEEFGGCDIFLGADLSGSQDLTALAFVVPTGEVERASADGEVKLLPTFDAWVEAWTPGDTVSERALRDQAPYDVWVRDGWLNAPDGKQIRLDFVAARVAEADAEYRVKALAYDRYSYRKLEDELDALGVTVPQIEHPQGGKRRAKVPDEELEAARREGREPPQGLWMPGSVAALEALILDGRIRLRRSPVLISACMSAVTETDPFDNRWFSKRKATNRIDAVVALAMAVGAATGAAPASTAKSFWETMAPEEA
ncbi:terminase large subunit [Rhodovarius lipocyclicus]|uniref:terminase large subunit n=1 Tax=Rhodovarius lipocyclicus TaxID=268410 RepID=UPI001357B5C0|nr:terminase TerL endonuclease subunit [Rhodovarius lipocyclicus]